MSDEAEAEVEAEIVPEVLPKLPWASDDDEMRRAYIVQEMATPDVDGKILVQNMELVFRWMKNGIVPEGAGHVKKLR